MRGTALTLLLPIFWLAACYGTNADDGSDSGGSSHGGSSSGASSSGGTSSAGSGTSGSGTSGSGAAGTSGSGGSAGATGDPPPWETWQACSVTEDCTVLPLDSCCGCMPTGVNKEYEQDALAVAESFDPSQCPPGLGCPYQPCPPDSMVACEMGVCVPKPGCSERSEQDCESDDQCQAYQGRLCASTDPFAYFACGTPKTVCTEAETCGVSPFGQEVLFPDGCMPDGYSETCVSQCQ